MSYIVSRPELVSCFTRSASSALLALFQLSMVPTRYPVILLIRSKATDFGTKKTKVSPSLSCILLVKFRSNYFYGKSETACGSIYGCCINHSFLTSLYNSHLPFRKKIHPKDLFSKSISLVSALVFFRVPAFKHLIVER